MIRSFSLERPDAADSKLLLEGYFVLDPDLRELVWFSDVERFVGMEEVVVAHLSARARKSTVIEWYYDGISPLVSDCLPVKRQFDGARGYRDEVEVAHTGCCDIRYVQRLKLGKQLLIQVFDVLSENIMDEEARARARSMFRMGVPLNHSMHGLLCLGFKASFWDDGALIFDEEAVRYSYLDLVSNADVYEKRPTVQLTGNQSPSM